MSDPTTTPAARDTITIKNLQLPHGLLAPDVWGNLKEQPALISITLHLHGNGFNTAANQDALDVSTIHYGQLAKLIRSNSVPDSTPSTLDTQIAQSITAMATKSTGNFIVAESIVEINLPKASMYGDAGISIITSTSFTTSGTETSSKQTFSIKDVKIMTLLGVNTYERTANQPLLASLNVYIQGSRDTAKLFGLERHLVEVGAMGPPFPLH